MRTLAAVAVFALLSARLQAQSVDDGAMMTKGTVVAGSHYTYETWDEYWEGELKRTNGNIGTITTRINTWYGGYGLTNRLNVIVAVPYVWTDASQGVLHGIQGFQDLTVAVKYNAFEKTGGAGSLRAIAVVATGFPLANYNPELPPLSIGSGATRVGWRGTVSFDSPSGWFLTGSGSYSWRSQVQLDRPYFFTNDEFVMSDTVDMPNATDYTATVGLMKRGLMGALAVTQQRTHGGGDIRRQDMPFVSNRMNFTRMGGMVTLPVPKVTDLGVQLAYAYTINGRNVGQAASFTTGLVYRFGGSTR